MALVTRLTEQHLLNTIAAFPLEIQAHQSSKTFYLSLAIVRHFLGSSWADDHVQSGGHPGYLKLDWEDKEQSEIQTYRIVDLAEILFNLQHIHGFDDCLQKMKEGDIEGTYAELDLGRLLYQSYINFRFIKRSGSKGNDFDIEIALDDGTIVCADAKCKVEATTFSENTVINSLRHARSQFPPNRPSVIFMKVPPRWLQADQDIGAALIDIAKSFLRSTGRIVSVKYYTSHITWKDGVVTHVQAFREINNTNSSNRFDPSRNWDLFEQPRFNVGPNSRGEFSDVPERWFRLLYYPEGIPK